MRKPTAEEIRQRNIEIYQDSLRLPKCFTGSHDAPYNLRAYEMMTGREILASEKIDNEFSERSFQDSLKRYRDFKKESRDTRIVARMGAA